VSRVAIPRLKLIVALFSLSPCRACTTGWTAELPSVNASESRYAWTSKHPSSVELNFTGTGISFSLFYPSSSSSWASSIFINGSAISNSTQANDLPWGLHHARLDLEPSTSNELNDWVRFEGAKISLGSLVGAKTKNGTIDDSVWRDGNVSLSSGWNMMEKGQSNWLNQVCLNLRSLLVFGGKCGASVDLQTQMEIEGSHALNYWNESLSWTEQEGANTSITFTGAAVWVYGVVGSEAGSAASTLSIRVKLTGQAVPSHPRQLDRWNVRRILTPSSIWRFAVHNVRAGRRSPYLDSDQSRRG